MIDQVIKAIATDLNNFFKLSLNTNDPLVVISNLIHQNGQVPPNLSNKLICSLINIEQESFPKSSININKDSGNIINTPPISLNLHLLFASSFETEDYMEGLNHLSRLVSFFHEKRIYTQQNTPELPSTILKIAIEQVNVNLTELNSIWGALGVKYMPSVIYKVRDLMLDNTVQIDDIPSIQP